MSAKRRIEADVGQYWFREVKEAAKRLFPHYQGASDEGGGLAVPSSLRIAPPLPSTGIG
jgi:hypothetical protein